MREVLHDEEGLTVALVIADETAVVELNAKPDGPDLSAPDEVVIVVDGKGLNLEVESPQKASAVLAEELDAEPEPTMMMVRVHEFFEGWELFAEDSDD